MICVNVILLGMSSRLLLMGHLSLGCQILGATPMVMWWPFPGRGGGRFNIKRALEMVGFYSIR